MSSALVPAAEPYLGHVGRLAVGDLVRVLPGEAFAADGTVEAGVTSVDEALLTGESRPVPRGPGQAVLYSAHYDHLGTHGGKTFHGADDNAAAVAELVDLGRALAPRPPEGRHVLLVAFDGEEPPHFLSDTMGSAHFCRYPTVPLAGPYSYFGNANFGSATSYLMNGYKDERKWQAQATAFRNSL